MMHDSLIVAILWTGVKLVKYQNIF